MKKKWIGTGWKMNHLIDDSENYALKLLAYYTQERPESNIFICPPFTALKTVSQVLKDTPILVGAQNVHWLEKGAMTGEISPLMIKDAGAKLVEIGHSERRQFFNETDSSVNKKVLAALANDIRPIICIGESSDDKDFKVTQEKLTQQLKIGLHDVTNERMSQVIIAYEPVWAIGSSGKPATPDYVNEIHSTIRKTLADISNESVATSIPVIYGGSVNNENAIDLISQPQVDGLFIGRSAWDADNDLTPKN
jgi:triosephosphate isomerase